jgi:hypothetical protein
MFAFFRRALKVARPMAERPLRTLSTTVWIPPTMWGDSLWMMISPLSFSLFLWFLLSLP